MSRFSRPVAENESRPSAWWHGGAVHLCGKMYKVTTTRQEPYALYGGGRLAPDTWLPGDVVARVPNGSITLPSRPLQFAVLAGAIETTINPRLLPLHHQLQ